MEVLGQKTVCGREEKHICCSLNLRWIGYIGILIILLNKCGIKENNNENNVIENSNSQEEKYIYEEPLQGSVYFVEDNEVYFYDTMLYDLFNYTFSPDNVKKYIPFLDSITKIYIPEKDFEGNIITYHFKKSWIRMFELVVDSEYACVDFDIFDKRIELKNGLKVGLSRDSFNIIYPESKKYNNISKMSLTDESGFGILTCYFKKDTINEIFYWNIEVLPQCYDSVGLPRRGRTSYH